MSESWEIELDALTMAIKSTETWYKEYVTSQTPQFIEEFIATVQFHLRLENRYVLIYTCLLYQETEYSAQSQKVNQDSHVYSDTLFSSHKSSGSSNSAF